MRCSACGLTKGTSEFPKNGSSRCKACKNAYLAAWRAANPDSVRASRAKTYAAHHEQNLARAKAYREANPEARKKIWDSWYAKNRDARLEYHREYRQDPVAREGILAREAVRYGRDPHVSARRLIQTRVAKGRMPSASDCACTDCAGQAEEYDHYLGYEGKARSQVQPVCRPCHLRRTVSRKEPVV